MNEIMELLDRTKAAAESLARSIQTETDEMEKLKRAGLIYAGTWYKAGKYLYLVYPSDGNGDRKRDYIGADEDKITTALAGIERGQKYNQCKARKEALQSKMNRMKQYLNAARYAGIGD